MKYLLPILFASATISAFGQVKVSQGQNSSDFKLTKQPKFTSFAKDETSYFVISNKNQTYEKSYTLIAADKSGNIITDKDVQLNPGVSNNSYDLTSILVVGKSPVAFVENHSKGDGKNTLTTRMIDNNGNMNASGITVGSMDLSKMSNPGEWYTCLSPDKKHVAVLGKVAHEKNAAEQFKYFILDEDLKETGKGQFSFAGNTNEISIFDFLTSDKGDLYIISEDFDKTYKYPVLYQYSAADVPSIVPVMISDPGLKNLSYTCSVNPNGNLLIAGYMQKKKTFSSGDSEAAGTWLFNSAKPSEVKTSNFDKPVTNMTARNIVYNGDTFFLIGEQYKADKEQGSTLGMAQMRLGTGSNYTYIHNDLMVTGFNTDGNKKFEMPISRKWSTRNQDQEFMIASGVVGNKLALVYNDDYSKYIDDKYRKNTKLPIAVSISNDGLMDAPVHFAKQLDVIVSTYTLLPQYFSVNEGKIIVLSGNAQSVKTVIFE